MKIIQNFSVSRGVFFSELNALDSSILLFLIISLEIFFDSNLNLLKHYRCHLLAKCPVSGTTHYSHLHVLGLRSLKLCCNIIFCWNIAENMPFLEEFVCFLWFSAENMLPETTSAILVHRVLCLSASVFQHEKSLTC